VIHKTPQKKNYIKHRASNIKYKETKSQEKGKQKEFIYKLGLKEIQESIAWQTKHNPKQKYAQNKTFLRIEPNKPRLVNSKTISEIRQKERNLNKNKPCMIHKTSLKT